MAYTIKLVHMTKNIFHNTKSSYFQGHSAFKYSPFACRSLKWLHLRNIWLQTITHLTPQNLFQAYPKSWSLDVEMKSKTQFGVTSFRDQQWHIKKSLWTECCIKKTKAINYDNISVTYNLQYVAMNYHFGLGLKCITFVCSWVSFDIISERNDQLLIKKMPYSPFIQVTCILFLVTYWCTMFSGKTVYQLILPWSIAYDRLW